MTETIEWNGHTLVRYDPRVRGLQEPGYACEGAEWSASVAWTGTRWVAQVSFRALDLPHEVDGIGEHPSSPTEALNQGLAGLTKYFDEGQRLLSGVKGIPCTEKPEEPSTSTPDSPKS